jgi:hypothetical protein
LCINWSEICEHKQRRDYSIGSFNFSNEQRQNRWKHNRG